MIAAAAPSQAKTIGPRAVIRLPQPHEHQRIFTEWHERYPEAQVLVAPCGTKLGKTFGSSIWLLTQALVNPGFFCVWIAPTLDKCRIAYRYMKAMLPDIPEIDPKDGRMEIYFGNGSVIKFLHGYDAEVTVEGEAIDAFVIDEAGKQKKQLWFSLFTTITQTLGLGIITGTPRGHNWYYDVFRAAQQGDPFFCWVQLATSVSPFVSARAIAQAKRLLPKNLFDQYYEAKFVVESTVYGDLTMVWRDDLAVARKDFWLHPDAAQLQEPVCVGYDPAKRKDAGVFFAVNTRGETVGYVRMKGKPYKMQAKLLAKFCARFQGVSNEVRFDRTGVGDAVGEMIGTAMEQVTGDWTVTPVVFNNQVKQDLVARATVAIEEGWWRAPRIPQLEHEFASLEVKTTKTGLHSYAAPDGDHDDVHWAACLALSGAHAGVMADAAQDMIEQAMSGKMLTSLSDQAEDDDDLGEDDDGDDIAALLGVNPDDEEDDFDFDPEEN